MQKNAKKNLQEPINIVPDLPAIDVRQQYWKKAFLIISICITGIMLLLSHAYGLSGDEWLQMDYGHDIWNYFANGNPQALNYDNLNQHYNGLQFYGGLFDLFAEILHHCFPSIQYIYLRHFINAGTGATMMIFTGLLARRVSSKWSIAVIALLFIFFSPRIFGESMNNPKDIPFACGFIIAVYSLVGFLQDYQVKTNKHVIGIAIGFAMAMGVRSAGGFMLLGFIVTLSIAYYLLNKDLKTSLSADNNKLLTKAALLLIASIITGYIVALLAWPWGLQSPISNPLTSLEELTNRKAYFKVLFEGVYRMNYNMPWYYELKWILISSPLIVIGGVLLFTAFSTKAIKKYSLFFIILLFSCALLPLLYIIYKHSTVYDSWRHVFFVYPFWIIMSALAVDLLQDAVKNQKFREIPVYIALAGLIPMIIWMVKSHPNQYVYFNELAGGVKSAYGNYEIDYYQNSAGQACNWIKKNAKPSQGKKLTILSNMMGINKYFEADARFIVDTGVYEQRHTLNYDYFISNGRYIPVAQLLNHKWPPQNTVFEASADGIPLSVVLIKKSYTGNEANAAFQKQDYPAASSKYEQYLGTTDSLDEAAYVNYALSLANIGNIEKAIAMLNKAISFNPQNASYYTGLKGLYELKGDNVNAKQAEEKANNIKFEEQELNPPLEQ